MEDKKETSKTDLKIEAKNGKVKKEWTVKRVLTTVIIAILALLMVGGSFYYILSPSFRSDANAFGYYDGEPVLYESNNLFARTLMSDEDYANAASTGDYSTIFSSWYKAYQSQVVYLALTKMAKQAGILAPQSLVDKMIIDSGAYNGEDGTFSVEKYNETSNTDKQYFYNYMTSIYPFQTVVSDLYSTLTSDAEKSFIAEIASKTRTFEYFVVGSSNYPDYLARSYANENPELFKLVDLSIISCTTVEVANECYNALNSGLSWEEAVSKYSADTYASENGKVGEGIYSSIIANNMLDANNVALVASLKAGEYTVPVENTSSTAWIIYKADSDVKSVDLYDETTLLEVKELINQKEPELVKAYIESAVEMAKAAVKSDFTTAAESYGAGVISVGPAVNNIGSSQLLYGIEYYDQAGYLNEAVTNDEALNSTLFSEAVGYVAGPVETDYGYLFVKVVSAATDSELADVTKMLYSYYASQFNVIDAQNAIISSDKHEDKFTAKFLDVFFGSVN